MIAAPELSTLTIGVIDCPSHTLNVFTILLALAVGAGTFVNTGATSAAVIALLVLYALCPWCKTAKNCNFPMFNGTVPTFAGNV
ncbi:hypothetical protein D3C80_1222550 [compost metagenome]